MGLLEELGAWLDQKKRNVAANVRQPGLLWTQLNEDARQYQRGWREDADNAKSVMPEVRQQANASSNAKAMELGGLLGAIKAFHGSPHKFDKFDLSKIGTGEGAQAYGHGLYMAESPEVAKSYADTLGGYEARDQYGRVVYSQDKREAFRKNTPEYIAYHAIKFANDSGADDLYKEARRWIGPGKDSELLNKPQFANYKKAYELLDEWELANVKPGSSGNMYEANIRWPDAAREAADPLGPQHFLDWDKPLSEQPETVRHLLSMADKKASRLELQGSMPGHETTGADAYRALGMLTPEFKSGGSGAGQASEMLKRKGIPGIRYLDGGSRGAGQGTSNYVVFDDNLLEILKRNGQPLGLLAP